MSSKFQVKIGHCVMCPAGSEATHVAVYANGLTLCEKHDDQVRLNHRGAYRDHPLRRDHDGR